GEGFERCDFFLSELRFRVLAWIALCAGISFSSRVSLWPRRQLNLIHIGSNLFNRVVHRVVILNVSICALDRLGRQFHIPISHYKILSKYPKVTIPASSI